MSDIRELQTDLHDKADKARYHNYFLLPKDQPEYFSRAAEVLDNHLNTLHDECYSQTDIDNVERNHDKCEKSLEVLENAHQFAYNEIVILIEDLGDRKLDFTRPGLAERLNKLLKKLKANIP